MLFVICSSLSVLINITLCSCSSSPCTAFCFLFQYALRGVVWAHLWWQPSCHGSLKGEFGLHRKSSHYLYSSVLSCYDVRGPNAVCWLFYSSCFAGWILSTVVTITLLSLGFSRDTVADVEGCVRVVLCSLSGVFPCPAHGSGHYFGLPRPSWPQWHDSVAILQLPQLSPGLLDAELGCAGFPQPALLPCPHGTHAGCEICPSSLGHSQLLPAPGNACPVHPEWFGFQILKESTI